ncbi:hypothetical protein PIROE2DRAFT_15399, partial [Piromyces sp. E2]
IDLTIEECDSSNLYQDIDNIGFNYKPECTPSCSNNGECININNEPKIKAGSVDFMYLILVGMLCNCVHILESTNGNKTKMTCIKSYLSNNIGFSLVFVHCTLITFWLVTDSINSTLAYTKDFKEYSKCSYPLSKNIRDVKENFKEKMTIPICTYIVFTVMIEIINMENEIQVNIQDIFTSIGTIIITIYKVLIESTLSPFQIIKRKSVEFFNQKDLDYESKNNSRNIIYTANKSDVSINQGSIQRSLSQKSKMSNISLPKYIDKSNGSLPIFNDSPMT